MDPEDERQDEQDISQSIGEGKKFVNNFFNLLKKALNTIKGLVITIMKLPPPVLAAIGILTTLVLTWQAISDWFENLFGNDNVSALASAEVITDAKIVKGKNGYYFEINQDLVDAYIKELNEAYKNGNFYLDDEENEEILKEYGKYKDENGEIVDENEESENEQTDDDTTKEDWTNDEFTSDDLQDWFASEEFESYLIRMLRAEIASSYPKLGTDGAVGKQEDGTIINDRPDGTIINPKKGDNYIAQGIIQVRRRLLDDVPDIQDGPGQYAGNIADADSIIYDIVHSDKVLVNCDGDKKSLEAALYGEYINQDGPNYVEGQYITRFSFANTNIKDTLEIILTTYNGYIIDGQAVIMNGNTGGFELSNNKDGKRDIDTVFENIKQNIEDAGGIIEGTTESRRRYINRNDIYTI